MKLSIIVPVYNVEKYIRPCVESIFRQGLDEDDFEVVIVNDGTPDKSMEIIADIIEAHQNIHVINQENQGISMARNNGIKRATGEYVHFLDSDDLLLDNSLSYLLDKATSSEADLIIADFTIMNDEQIAQSKNKPIAQKNGMVQERTGEELLTYDLNAHFCFVWNALYKRDFLNSHQLRFIPGIYFEDVIFTHQCYLNANRCLRVNWQFIIYRKGHDSITSRFNIKKAKDYCIVIANLWEMSKGKNLNESICHKFQDNTFISFSMLLYYLTTSRSISRSDKLYILRTLKKDIPDLSFENGLKQNIVNILYHRMPNTYLTLRIFYANYLQYFCWAIGDFIRNRRNTKIYYHD